MLKAIPRAELSITIEAYIYWAGEIGQQFAEALAAKARDGRPGQDPARRRRLIDDRRGHPEDPRGAARASSPGTTRSAGTSLGRYNHRTHRKSLIIDGRIAFTGGAGHRRSLERAMREDPGTGATCRSASRARRWPLQTGFAQNWLQTTGELISGPLFYPPPDAGRAARGADDHELARNRRVHGADDVLPVDHLRAPIDLHRQSVLRAGRSGDRRAGGCQRRGVDVRVMVGRHPQRQLAGAPEQRPRSTARCCAPGSRSSNTTARCCIRRRWSWTACGRRSGTTNFDNRSFAHNEENNVCFYDAEIACAMHETFLADAKVCERLTLERWAGRGVIRRAGEIVAAFLQEQI